jgi:hypothetical protein
MSIQCVNERTALLPETRVTGEPDGDARIPTSSSQTADAEPSSAKDAQEDHGSTPLASTIWTIVPVSLLGG